MLPAALFAIIGINGESLTSFVINFFVYLKNRRVVGMQEDADEAPAKEKTPGKQKKEKRKRPEKKAKPRKEDFAEEFGQFRERRQAKQAAPAEDADERRKKRRGVSQMRERMKEEPEPELINPSASYLPIRKIENGIIYTKDRRYVKVIEVIPINFLLRSAREQRNIIYSFISYLKISPVKLQFKVLTRRADINRHLETLREEMRQETDERCLALQKDYENLIRRIGSREAITRRFFIIFEYEPFAANRGNEESDAISALTTAVRTAKTYLQQCGNELLVPDNEDEMATEVFYSILNRRTSGLMPKRTRRINTTFLTDPLYASLASYTKQHSLPHFTQCVVCFSHVFDKSLSDRRVRDYDNLECKQLLDTVAGFLMTDDSGLFCDAYHTTEFGESDCTILAVMEKSCFPGWLKEREDRENSISDF